MTEEQRFDFKDLLSQVDFLDELLEADNEQQQPTQVPAAGYAGDVNDKELRDILGDEFMDSCGLHPRDKRNAPPAEPGTPAEQESDAPSSEGFASSCDSDESPFPQDEGMKKSAISSGTSCSMLVNRLNKNTAGMNDAQAGAQVCASMVSTVNLHFTDPIRSKEWKDRIGSVPEGWEEMCRKKGFTKCGTRLTHALKELQGSELEVEMLSISNVLSKIYRMSSGFVGAGMLFQATQAFVYEEAEAKGNVARTVLLVRALNTIAMNDIKEFWKEVCLTGTIPVKFAPRSGVSSDGPVIDMMGAEDSCEFAWTMFLTGWIKFLSKGQETDIDVAKWRLKYWATRERFHVLWQAVNSDGSLEDVELWFPREDGANAEMVRGEMLINGREKLAATLFERCRQAMLCMHPKFMEKYAVVVAQKALNDEEFEQKEGVPVVKDFEEMRDLLRKTQKVWKADPVTQGKVPKNSGRNGGGGNGDGNGGKKPSACRVCKEKGHKTKDCSKRAGTSCRLWKEKGVCSFGDDCVHEHKAAEKGTDNSSAAPAPTQNQRVPGKPAWIKPAGTPDGWKPPVGNTSMAMTKDDVPWTPGKVHECNCRGEACKKLFKEKEDDWLGRKLPNGEQLSMPVWCQECREKRRAMHSLCIQLEYDECDQDDREDDVPTERCGVLLEEVDMVVMVITAEKDINWDVPFAAATFSSVHRDRAVVEISAATAEAECGDEVVVSSAFNGLCSAPTAEQTKASEESEIEGLDDFLAGLEAYGDAADTEGGDGGSGSGTGSGIADEFYKVKLSAESRALPAYAEETKASEEMEGLEDFLAGLVTAQKHIVDVGASGEAEADAQVAGFRVMRGEEITIEPIVPMDHRMGGDRTVGQLQAAEEFSTSVVAADGYPQQWYVDDAVHASKAEAWWKKFLEEEGMPKEGCNLAYLEPADMPVKVAAHKVVSVEETTVMLRDLGIGAEAECSEVVPRVAQEAVLKESIKDAETVMVARMAVAEDWSRFNQNQQGQGGFYGDCSTVEEKIEKEAAYSKFLDQEMVLKKKGDSWQHYNGKPPQHEKRSAAAACLARAVAGTVTAALMQAKAVVEGKVAMYKHTPSEVSDTVKKKVTNEVMWMVQRQLLQWHSEAGEADLIDNETLVADWVTAMGKRENFGKWIKERIGEIDMSITQCDLPTMAVSAVTKRDRKEALEIAVKWVRHAAAERALFAPHGPQRWHLFDELLKWEHMLTKESSMVVGAVEAVGDQLEQMLGVHCEQREVWKAVQHMMSTEDAWLYRKVKGSDVEACEKLDLLDPSVLAMVGTSVEVQKAKRVSALRRGAGVVALVEVAKETAVISAVDRRMSVWTHKHDTQSMELISTLLQGSVSAMRMWVRVLAQGQEVTAEVKGGIADPDKVDWAKMVRSGSGRGGDPEVRIEVSLQFVDMLGVLISAGDEEGMGGSDDEPVALECGNGGQDVGGNKDLATQRVLLPDMPDFSSDGSSNNSSEEEDSVLFEKRQAGKFGTNSVSVKVGIQQGSAGKHIDSANIIESPRKRKAAVVHNVDGHSGDEVCELDDSDVGSEFEAAMGESASSVESGVSNFDSDDDKVCDVLRRRLGGSPVWTTNKDESKMDIEELDMSNMSVGDWCDYQSESGSGSGDNSGNSGSGDNSGGEGCSGKKKAYAKQEAMVTDAEVARWLEANQTPAKNIGSGDDSGSGAGSGCGTGSGKYCGSGSESVSSSQQGSASLVMLDYGVLRLVMEFLPKKKWCTILPTVFAGARHASVEGRKDSKFARMQRWTAHQKARVKAALLNNPWYCAAQLNC